MQDNLSGMVVGVADIQPIFLYPNWLRVRLDPKLSQNGRELSEMLLRTVALVLRDVPPDRAMVRCDVVEGALHFTFASSPRAGDVEHALLTNTAARLAELHNRRVAAEIREQKAADAVPGFDFDREVDSCRYDIDLDRLMAGRFRRTDVDVFRFAQDADQMEQRIKNRDGESCRRIAHTLERLALSGSSRPLMEPTQDWRTKLDQMEIKYPNFAEVLQQVIRPHVALRAMGLLHRLPPVLIVGDPGIGKTRFANALADLMNVPPPLFLSIASESNGSALAGSSTFWSNAAPGQLFEMLAWGHGGHQPVANPLLVLDEVDKPNAGAFSPLGALYSLLEEHTSKNYVDQALPDLSFDASHLRVVGTANDVELVPAALRSRMLVFHIPNPSADQVATIAQEIFGELICKLGVAFSTLLPDVFVHAFKGMSPRTIKMAIEMALAGAIVAGRDYLVAEDWPCIKSQATSQRFRQPMGIVSG